jgi:hypothetical protein
MARSMAAKAEPPFVDLGSVADERRVVEAEPETDLAQQVGGASTRPRARRAAPRSSPQRAVALPLAAQPPWTSQRVDRDADAGRKTRMKIQASVASGERRSSTSQIATPAIQRSCAASRAAVQSMAQGA